MLSLAFNAACLAYMGIAYLACLWLAGVPMPWEDDNG
jgi:hypothetical protein